MSGSVNSVSEIKKKTPFLTLDTYLDFTLLAPEKVHGRAFHRGALKPTSAPPHAVLPRALARQCRQGLLDIRSIGISQQEYSVKEDGLF